MISETKETLSSPIIKIRIKNLSKVFGLHPQKTLTLRDKGLNREEIFKQTGDTLGVSNITFDVYEGEMLVVMGLSGSGKSTFIRCLNRLIEPTEGEILMDGVDVTKLGKKALRNFRRKHFSMVFQNFALLPHRTVRENAEFGLEISGVDKSTRQERAQNALLQVGLAGWEEHFPNELSGGMQQRVGLARALANNSDVLLMDEAFSALDPLIRADMQQELLALQADMHKTIIFITHDLDEAINIGDRIVLLKDGEVVQIGTPEEILTQPANEYVARFVENVDRSKVLTAENIMNRPRAVVHADDGPHTAIYKMNEFDTESVFVVNKKGILLGLVNLEDATQAAKNQQPLSAIINDNLIRIELNANMNELYGALLEQNTPLAVVDKGKLRGTITRAMMLAKLAELSESNHEAENDDNTKATINNQGVTL